MFSAYFLFHCLNMFCATKLVLEFFASLFISFSFSSALFFMISFLLLILGFFVVVLLLFPVVLGVKLGCLFFVFRVS